MPGIIAFQRRWSVGSDDLVVPGLFLFSIHLVWTVALSVILALIEFDRPEDCVYLLWQHMIGYLAVIVVSLLLELMISLTALRGSILDTEERKAVPSLIYIRLVVLLIEFIWLILGGMWLSHYYNNCPISTAKDALLGLVICSWFVMLSVFITLWCTFDPAGRSWVKMMNYQRSMKESESRFQYRRSGSCTRTWRQRKVLRAYQDSWDQRCRLLFCCMRHSDKSQNSFGDIARLLSDFFRDIDVVPSDVVAGLILLRKYQKIERESIVKQRINDTYEFLSGVPVTSGTQFLALNDPVHYAFFQDVIHYMTFALGAYGWPMYVMNNPTATVCKLCASLRCACLPCCRRSKSNSATIFKDNCCQCNYAALKQQVETGDVQVVYATFHVDVGITPFFVAVDYARKKIVVSIRGTLSMQDVITDLNAEGEPIPINPPRDDWIGHKGMVQVAVHIQSKLVSENILNQAFNFNPQRGTQDFKLVIVGHSLGAGAAAILSILLRQQYPDVICFSYSPPGGTLSMAATEYTKAFVTSVVVGKDVVPRIGLHQMESLRADLMHAIKRSKDPKWKTISCSVFCCGCAGLPTSAAELKADDSMQLEYKKDKTKAREFVFHSQTSNVALTSHQPLYPPGRIIHVVRHHTTREEQVIRKRKPVYQALWANNTDFDEVLISPVMIQDHMPDNVLAALNKVITTVGPRKPQRTATFPNAMEPDGQIDSESCHLLSSNNLNSPKLHTPPHRLQLETSFTSLLSPNEKMTCKISLQSFGSHSSNNTNTITTNSLMKNDSTNFKNIKTEIHSPPAKNFVLWEYQSLLDDQTTEKAEIKYPNLQIAHKIDLIHDDWFGLAPLATPESLSEVSSISSRASSMIIHNEKAGSLTRDRFLPTLGHRRIHSNGFRGIKDCDSDVKGKAQIVRKLDGREIFVQESKVYENSDSSDSYLDSPPVKRNSTNLETLPTIDSRKSSGDSNYFNYGYHSPQHEVLLHNTQRSPRIIRRTPKIPKGLATAAEDVYNNQRFEEMMKPVIRTESYDSMSNETNSYTSAKSHDIEKSSSELFKSVKSTPLASSGDSITLKLEFHTPENKVYSKPKTPKQINFESDIRPPKIFRLSKDDEDINYHKPTMVILPTDKNFPTSLSHRNLSNYQVPYLETDFSLSDPDVNLVETKEICPKSDKKIKFVNDEDDADIENEKLLPKGAGSERIRNGISFDQDYEFDIDIETESTRLIDSNNVSETSLFQNTYKSLQTQDSCYRDEDSIEETLKPDDCLIYKASFDIQTKVSQNLLRVSDGRVKSDNKNQYSSRSAEALPLLTNINSDYQDRKRKYSFSILTIGKGESSV